MTQLSMSGRVVTLCAISQGNCYRARPGDTTWTAASNVTGDSPPLIRSGVVLSAANNQKLYFAEGNNWALYDPRKDEVQRWSASRGELPIDSENNTPRLICTWRGRTVLSGLILDPQNWFMSAVGDATDWNYGDVDVPGTQAVAGSVGPQGLVGDIITSLCPYSDDVLIFFCDHSVYLMSGDPCAGGTIDLVSDTIGGTWGVCWAKDPYGNVFFVSNKMGIYVMRPGSPPQRISQPIEQLLSDADTGNSVIRLVWDDKYQGVHIFITQADEPAPATHFFYEQRSGSWWTEVFGNDDHNPVTCCIFDGNEADDRVAVIGSWDGYVRAFSATATDDDGTPIESFVLLGPILTKDKDEVNLKELQMDLGATSGDVDFSVLTGATAELALDSDAALEGTWEAGRNLTDHIRVAAHAIYVKLSASVRWAMEGLRARVATQGKIRARGH